MGEWNPEIVLVGEAGLVELIHELNHDTNVLLAGTERKAATGAWRRSWSRPIVVRHIAVKESQVVESDVQRGEERVVIL